MDRSLIATLTPGGSANPIEIKVLRQWTPFINRKECRYIFVDKKGDAVEAVANPQESSHFGTTLNLLSCYRLTNYICQPAKGIMKTIPHSVTLKLGKTATFTPIPDTNFPKHYFRFLTYESLHSRLNNHQLLTDYIGKIVGITETITRNNAILLKIKVEDPSGNIIEAALWEEIACMFDRQTATSSCPPVIIALTSMKVTEYEGKLQIGSTAATHVYLNPEIEETHALIAKFKDPNKKMDLNEDIIEITTSQRDIITEATLTDLLNLQPENYTGNNFSCIASITKIDVKQGWYYKACTICHKKLLPRGPKFACDNHGDIDEPALRYSLTATLSDESNIASAIFFDEAVTSLLQSSCTEMVITKGFTDAFVLPEPLQLVLGKQKTFHLKLRDRSRQKSSNFVATQVVHNTDTEITIPPPLLLTPPTKLRPQQAATPDVAEGRITRGKKRIFQSTDEEETSSKKPKDPAD